MHEREKVEKRWPAAMKFITDNQLNEFFAGDLAEIGIITQGGTLQHRRCGRSRSWGWPMRTATRVPLYVLNVTYPLIDQEVVRFCAGKKPC